jgi:hypothetical protein
MSKNERGKSKKAYKQIAGRLRTSGGGAQPGEEFWSQGRQHNHLVQGSLSLQHSHPDSYFKYDITQDDIYNIQAFYYASVGFNNIILKSKQKVICVNHI